MNDFPNLTPDERDQIVREFAEYALESHLATHRYSIGRDISCQSLAETNPERWKHNHREGTIQAIRSGHETWERVYEVAAKYRAQKGRQPAPPKTGGPYMTIQALMNAFDSGVLDRTKYWLDLDKISELGPQRLHWVYDDDLSEEENEQKSEEAFHMFARSIDDIFADLGITARLP